MSVVKQTIHLWRQESTEKTILARVDYNIPSQTKTNHPLFTSVVVNNIRPPEEEMVLLRQSVKSGWYTMLRPKQKKIGLMEDIVAKLTRPGGLMID